MSENQNRNEELIPHKTVDNSNTVKDHLNNDYMGLLIDDVNKKEIILILEHLKELKVSFLRFYDLNPIAEENPLKNEYEELINLCSNYFDETIHKIELLDVSALNSNGILKSLEYRISVLDQLVVNGVSNGSIPLYDVSDVFYKINSLLNDVEHDIKNKEVAEERDQIFEGIKETQLKIEDKYKEYELMDEDFKHKKINEIYYNDSLEFKKLSHRYEVAFYLLILFLFLYFLGLTIYIPEINIFSFKIGFPLKIHGNLSAEFYIQKVSLLILSTTLLAFLLKRAFMYRRFADESYRTSKELIALPRYIKDLPKEMQNKINFDLAYKYFGNSIHHESYTGGENLMHENIKANTEFLKSVKDLSSGNAEDKENKNGG